MIRVQVEVAAGGLEMTMAAAIREHGHEDVRTPESLEEAIETLADEVRGGDLVLTLGAGDVWKVGPALAERLGANAINQADTEADNDSP